MNFFDKLNDGIRNIEASFVNFISAVAPWLAPLVPAYMTYWHAVDTLDFPEWVAFPAALVVEILGFSAVSTFMTFWFFNRRNKANAKKAPLPLVVFAFFFYLALIVTSNILLDASGGAEWAVIAVRALFTLQTIPAALIVVARAGHRSLLSDMAKEKAESDRKVTETKTESDGKFPVSWRQVRKQLSNEDVTWLKTARTEEICFRWGVDDRTARNWRKYAQAGKQ
jgi:polyferredoxin